MGLLFCFLILQLCHAPVLSASGAAGASFLLTEPGARPVAMAGAFTAMTGDLNAINYNPASICTFNTWQCSFAHVSLYQDTVNEWVAAAGPFYHLGSIGGYLLYTGDNNFVITDDNGNDVGKADAYNIAGSFAYAGKLMKSLAGGILIKGFSSKLYQYTNYGLALDAGAQLRSPMRGLFAGLSIQNAGYQTAFIQVADPLPEVVRAGILYHYSLGRLYHSQIEDNRMTVSVEHVFSLVEGEVDRNLAGVEFGLGESFFFRGGLMIGEELAGYSLGFGAAYENFRLDYAYVPYEYLGDTHRLQLTYSFSEAEQAPAQK